MYQFITRIKVLIRFLPTLWNNTVWYDYSSIFYLLEAQLKYMEDNWDKGYSCDSPHRLKEIKECRILVQRILEDDYTDAEWRIMEGVSMFEGTPFNYISQEHHEKQRKQDIDRLFGIMSSKIEYWWD